MLSRGPPLSTHLGIGHDEHDQEGRVVTAEFDRLFVVSVYVPNSGATAATPSSRGILLMLSLKLSGWPHTCQIPALTAQAKQSLR